MHAFIDKLMILSGCFLLQLYEQPNPGALHIITLLSAITFLCLCTYCNPDFVPFTSLPTISLYFEISLLLLFFLCALIQPMFGFFLPLLFYELILNKTGQFLFLFLIIQLCSPTKNNLSFLLFLLLFAFAFLLKRKTLKLLQLESSFKQLRDTSEEDNLLLHLKNQELIKQQNSEIHVATLRERNRIAREIHDNVGHMLSRSILQSGALLAINKDENLKEPLTALKDTLYSAMNSIRESVHDLHDDSIDLKSSLHTMMQDFTDYNIHLDYDMGNVLPQNIKYCFIAIAKEALSNISRHSNASKIRISAQEHPSFYQLIIEDNGTDIKLDTTGIGLENMKERTEQLHGHFSISTREGFRIFVSVPKVE